MTKINGDLLIDGTNLKLRDIPNIITTENISVSNIEIPSKTATYAQYTIPSKTGYTPIAIAVDGVNGASSGYTVVMAGLDGWLALYNGANSDVSIRINLKIIYLKSS
jgi:hypothetical protein